MNARLGQRCGWMTILPDRGQDVEEMNASGPLSPFPLSSGPGRGQDVEEMNARHGGDERMLSRGKLAADKMLRR